MKILMTGSSGLIGSALSVRLTETGDQVTPVVRRTPPAGSHCLFWDLESPDPAPVSHFEGFDAVVHLAGEPLDSGRWTRARKQRLYDSRVRSTRKLADALTEMRTPPAALLCASAVGYYGDRGDQILTEASNPGTGFLAELCRDWEQASGPAAERGIRVVRLRMGVVLSRRGGALPRMLAPFRMGLGGRIGSGRQYWSWISLDDVLDVYLRAIRDDRIHGAVNAVSPNPVTNLELTRTLARVLSRPAVFPMPSFAARIALGEMADELLLSSARVEPALLHEARFQFRHPTLESALRPELT